MSFESRIVKTPLAERIFAAIEDAPIYDYHCHLSPKEMREDLPFRDIAELWLKGDHYKWRLMRQSGVPEEEITGDAPLEVKWQRFAESVATAVGNPVRDWAMLELEHYFGITTPLNGETAAEIRARANAVIGEKALSPLKLIEAERVRYVATTDDPADSLEDHRTLRAKGLPFEVAPTFRADRIFTMQAADYPEYLSRLGEAAGVEITDYFSLIKAIDARMAFFRQNGCRFADIGTEDFPTWIGNLELSDRVTVSAVKGESVEREERLGWMGRLYVDWLKLAAKHKLTVQLHLSVFRNASKRSFDAIGPDAGFDTVATGFNVGMLKNILSTAEAEEGLPEIILYTLNPADYTALITLSGSFRNVTVGMAWWFNDHIGGMREYLQKMSELSNLSRIYGMLTDSRSFFSYARHRYFRMILADYLAELPEPEALLIEVARAIAYRNLQTKLGGSL